MLRLIKKHTQGEMQKMEEKMGTFYDKNKQLTGRTMKRNDWTLKDDEYHLTVLGVIRRSDGKFLITKRVMTKAWAPGWWEVSGGAAQAGESSEEAVRREVLEETGLHIKNLKYFGSQPWPYPSGIMIGFTADYESGNIKLQQEELNAGAFYTKDNLPEIPKKLSLARKLIDAWLEEKDHL